MPIFNYRIQVSLPFFHRFRFCNLPHRCTLELVPLSESEVSQASRPASVCLQLPSGERKTSEFSPSETLESVLAQSGVSLDDSELGSEGEVPVVVFMRKEVVGREELARTTLKAAGVTGGGRALLR